MEAILEAIRREPVRGLYAAALAAGAISRAVTGRRPDAADAVVAAVLVAGGELARAAVAPLRDPEIVHELDETDVGEVELDVPEDVAEEPAAGP